MMKNLKNLLPLFVILLGLGLVFTQSAFKARTGTVWVFDGVDIDDAKDANFYHVDSSAPSCPSGETVPCKIITEGNTSTDPQDLQLYLDEFQTEQALLAASEGTRD